MSQIIRYYCLFSWQRFPDTLYSIEQPVTHNPYSSDFKTYLVGPLLHFLFPLPYPAHLHPYLHSNQFLSHLQTNLSPRILTPAYCASCVLPGLAIIPGMNTFICLLFPFLTTNSNPHLLVGVNELVGR